MGTEAASIDTLPRRKAVVTQDGADFYVEVDNAGGLFISYPHRVSETDPESLVRARDWFTKNHGHRWDVTFKGAPDAVVQVLP